MTIVPATTPELIAQVRLLFQAYWDSFQFTPCFQGFADEVAALPGVYAPPRGGLFLGLEDGAAAGCVAFKPLNDTQCEAKRLYVAPAFRGRGLGRTLLEHAIAAARSAGYRELVGDTIPEVMAPALAMYERMGFERVTPYAESATPGAVCIRLRL
ncbi:MAG: GNAT family N-acetyltransferase [Bryobacteraceae bacterium]|nr:GNAT family N-acetyltransferase [Bryobacteraceae bacterium]